jgi:natural product precursor
MEKLKKLVLRKEVISNLNDPQMKRLRGGGGGTGVLGAWWCEDTQDLKTSCGPSCDNAEYPQEQCPNDGGGGGNTNTYLYSVPLVECPYEPPSGPSGYQWCMTIPLDTCAC